MSMSFNFAKLRTPQAIFIIYILVCSGLIMVFRFIFPGSSAPLLLYSREWRIVQGLLEVFNWYPALALSALVIPFGLVSFEENYQRFSDVFFKRIMVSVITAICAAVIYAVIFFLALPMVKNSEESMLYNGELFQLSKTHARERRSDGEWIEASQFLAICDSIWTNSPELADLRLDIEINIERLQSEENYERYLARTSLDRGWWTINTRDVSTLSEEYEPLDATTAIDMGNAALNEGRLFDAHWLFTLAGRLAIPGSPEAVYSARFASDVWNMISSQAPNQREQRLYEIHNLKLSGYQAMNTGDWIRAYYIFLELLEYTPDDPDAKNFFAASEQGAAQTAFFIDEMELSLGEILTGAVFSLPDSKGRVVLRFSSLTTFDDIAYGMGFEYMSFDVNSAPAVSVRSRYAKLVPFMLDGKPQILILSHALDRNDKDKFYDSEWLIGNKTAGGILINISFEDFLLLSHTRRGLARLEIADLFIAADKFSNTGYIRQIFQAEILNRVGAALFFLPAAIFVIIIGWRYRVKERARYLFIIMLVVLPVIFHGFVFVYRTIINTLGIWLVLSMGFPIALTIYICSVALLLLITLISLSAQHN
jgi:hypothetical protein